MKTTWKILWVEDNYAEINFKVTPLVQSGWKVVPCTNARDAENLIQGEDRFDCYMIDLKLPVIGPDIVEDRVSDDDERYVGIGLIRLIRRHIGDNAPIIVYSVVHDPDADRTLDELKVTARFAKGPNTTNKEVCDAVKRAVGVVG